MSSGWPNVLGYDRGQRHCRHPAVSVRQRRPWSFRQRRRRRRVAIDAPCGISLTPTVGGIYYLGVSSFDADPVGSAGPIFEGEEIIDDVRYWVAIPPGGDQPVSGWTLFGTYTGDYHVELTGTTSGCLPVSKADCKDNGWRTFGTMFKNQGQCVSFVNHSP